MVIRVAFVRGATHFIVRNKRFGNDYLGPGANGEAMVS